ncbi:CHAT domain-containing protein [Dactylosporangium sp. CS-033363]|uniref:CHAT domain-containing protein n=1 Tax=Dactylosporangium sp. CS-033363 TaxID=3239935 RepID=UPI003D8CD636
MGLLRRGRPDRAAVLTDEAADQFDSYLETGDFDTLTQAARLAADAVVATRVPDPLWPSRLFNLSYVLLKVYRVTGSVDVLRSAAVQGRAAVEATEPDDADRAQRLTNLVAILNCLAAADGDVATFREAASFAQAAVLAPPTGSPGRATRLYNLAAALDDLFDATGDLDVLRAAAAAGRSCLEEASPGDAGRDQYADHQCRLLQKVFKRTGDLEALHEAIAVARATLADAAGEEPLRGSFADSLGSCLHSLFQHTGDVAALREAIAVRRAGCAAVPLGHPSRPRCLFNLAVTLFGEFEATGGLDALREAMSCDRAAMAAVSTDDVHHAMYAHHLSCCATELFERTGEPPALAEAEAAARIAVSGRPADPASLARHRHQLGVALRLAFDEDGRLDTLREAVAVGKAALDATPDDDPDRAQRVVETSFALGLLGAGAGEPDALADALALLAPVIAATGAGDPARPGLIRAFGVVMAGLVRPVTSGIFDERVDPAPPQSSGPARHVAAVRGAIATAFAGVGRPAALRELSAACALLAEQVRSPEQAELAVAVNDAALRHTDPETDAPAHRLLLEEKARTADLTAAAADLDPSANAVPPAARMPADLSAAERDAMSAALAAHGADPQRPDLLSEHAVALLSRYRIVRAMADLTTAIGLLRAAAGSEDVDDPGRAEYCKSLGYALELRYTRSESLTDLDAAVDAYRTAVELSPRHGRLWATYQANLGDALVRRGSIARNLGRMMLGNMLRAADEMLRAGRTSGGSGTITRAELDADLDGGILALREAEAAMPIVDGPRRALVLQQLADGLWSRYVRDRDLSDLDEVIGLYGATLAGERPSGRASIHGNLADALVTRFMQTRDPRDFTMALRLYRGVADDPAVAPLERIDAARTAARWLESTSPGLAADLLEQAVQLLPGLFSPELDRSDLTHLAEASSRLTRDAAALALADPGTDDARRAGRALRLLETGQSALANQASGLRLDAARLRGAHPELAERLAAIRARLADDPTLFKPGAAPLRPVGAPGRHDAAAGLAALLTEVRALPGFGSFGTAAGPDTYAGEAAHGPIVFVNISPGPDNEFISRGRALGTLAELQSDLRAAFGIADSEPAAGTGTGGRSDAILLTATGVRSLALPALTPEAVARHVRDLYQATSRGGLEPETAEQTITRTLEWLWDAVAGPVLEALGHSGEPPAGEALPRMWWAPGGLLGLLPLHAAGYHRDQPGGRRSVMDRVVCSYTPTIDALHLARRRMAASAPAATSLIVAVPTNADSAGALPGARSEAASLQRILPAPRLLTSDATSPEDLPTVANVAAALSGHAIAHFACHARTDPTDAGSSCLELQDGSLTVADLHAVDLEGAGLAYLSACSTALIGTATAHSIDLIDNLLSVAGACFSGGYPHVIATQWEVKDSVSRRVARDFYAHLRTDSAALDISRAAHALNVTARAMRDRFVDDPSAWACYLHIGI